MKNLISETMEIASEHFKDFGFEDEQIVPLLESGKRDLTKELNKLQELLSKEVIDIHSINLSVHALKGLFLTMGNAEVGNVLNELHKESANSHKITEIKHVLRI